VRIARGPDRDTYVEPGTVDFDSLLLVGTSGTFEARTFLRVPKFTLPDTTLPGFTLQGVTLELTRNLTMGFDPTTVTLYTTTAWDTTTVGWPGPPLGTLLESATDDRLSSTFAIQTSITLGDLQGWAQTPATLPNFALATAPGQPVAAYVAGKARFRIAYTHDVSGSPRADTVNTAVTQDFYLHDPVSPPPTGADTTLVLGGLYKTEVALHFPVDSIPTGVSVDEATLVLRLLPTSAAPDTADVRGRLEVRAIRGPWSETATEQASLPADTVAITSGNVILLYSSAARSFAIRLPGALMRQWVASPSTNGGLLVRLVNRANLPKAFSIGSRESSLPAEVHISYTELPPGRF
jgi:hypothetical protein